MLYLEIDADVQFFTAFIIDAASKCIPQSSGISAKRRVLWWNEDCRKAQKKHKTKRGDYCVTLPLVRILSTLNRLSPKVDEYANRQEGTADAIFYLALILIQMRPGTR